MIQRFLKAVIVMLPASVTSGYRMRQQDSTMDNIIYELVLIFAGAAVTATLFLYLKQPIILAYIALGVAIGPSGLQLINSPEHIEHLSHVGIILLLFLIGLNLRPDK
ncbi:MAG: cation:proton antiporter, partial [Gammaproteobacteria bacterium]